MSPRLANQRIQRLSSALLGPGRSLEIDRRERVQNRNQLWSSQVDLDVAQLLELRQQLARPAWRDDKRPHQSESQQQKEGAQTAGGERLVVEKIEWSGQRRPESPELFRAGSYQGCSCNKAKRDEF